MMKHHMCTGSLLALMAALPALSWSSLAIAQTSPAAGGEPTQGIADIVVTAQHRAENLQKSSLAISVVSGEDLVQAGVRQAKDLSTTVPGLQIGQGGTAMQVFIRGVGDFSATHTSNPGVAFNSDGVVISRPQAIGLAFYDIARVEVLKGPQGTLYGRNASGGAINLITNKPSFDGISGYGSFEAGNLGLIHGSGAINIPLASNLALRGSFDIVKRDGYLTDGTNDDRHQAARLHLLWEPTAAISWLTTFDYAHVGGKGPGYVPNPRPAGSSKFLGSGDPVATNFLASQNPLGAAIVFGFPPLAYGFQNFRPSVDIDAWNVTSEFKYNMDWATLTALGGYRHFRDDEANYPGFLNENHGKAEQISAELRLNGDGDTLKWVAGLYYFHEKESGTSHIDEGVPTVLFASYPTNLTHSYAAFGQASYSVTPEMRLIAGGRYTYDKREVAGQQLTSVFLTPPVLSTFSGKTSFKSFTWKAGAEYDVTPHNMLFFTASTGFKAGGINFEPAPNTFRPEKLTAFELGMRNRFFGGRLQVNLEAFKWKYKDHQEGVVTLDSTGVINFLFKNAGKASLEGGSVDVIAKVTNDDTLKAFAEYNHSKYNSFQLDAFAGSVVPGVSTGCAVGPSAAGPGLVTLNCAGFQVARAPKWSGSAGWEHMFRLGDGAELSANASMSFSSGQWGSVNFVPVVRLPSYVTTNFDLTYTSSSRKWSVTAYVHNLTNEVVATGAQLQPFQPTQGYWMVNPPRTYGGRVTVNF